VRVLVNSTVANPNSGSLTLFTTAGESQHGSYAVNFDLENVDVGAYTVKIQWSERLGASLAHMGDRMRAPTCHSLACLAIMRFYYSNSFFSRTLPKVIFEDKFRQHHYTQSFLEMLRST
jgi:hypothetical protein